MWSYRERNFTEEIFGELGKNLGKGYVDYNFKWDEFKNFFKVNGDTLYDKGYEIDTYLYLVCDANHITNEKLNYIFRRVHSVEISYKRATDNVIDALNDYHSLALKFKDSIGATVGGQSVDIEFTANDTAYLQNRLSEHRDAFDRKRARDVELAMSAFVDSESGDYNWDKINEAVNRSPDIVTNTEVAALSLTYLSMENPSDITRFINTGSGGNAQTFKKISDITEAIVLAAGNYSGQPAVAGGVS